MRLEAMLKEGEQKAAAVVAGIDDGTAAVAAVVAGIVAVDAGEPTPDFRPPGMPPMIVTQERLTQTGDDRDQVSELATEPCVVPPLPVPLRVVLEAQPAVKTVKQLLQQANEPLPVAVPASLFDEATSITSCNDLALLFFDMFANHELCQIILSLAWPLDHLIARSIARSFDRLRDRSLTGSLAHSIACSLARSLDLFSRRVFTVKTQPLITLHNIENGWRLYEGRLTRLKIQILHAPPIRQLLHQIRPTLVTNYNRLVVTTYNSSLDYSSRKLCRSRPHQRVLLQVLLVMATSRLPHQRLPL